MKRVGVIGARGYTGRELLQILDAHPDVEISVAASGSAAGRPVTDEVPSFSKGLRFTEPEPEACSGLDAVLLALPNDTSAPFVDVIERASPDTVVVDLSADHRFSDDWVYGLVERNRHALQGARRIANPGCYATGMQLAIAPLLDVLAQDPVVFGVSGYSGAGTTPSRKNDPEVLADNLLPYALAGHVHEREASRHLGTPVRFMPHVASFFRGISLTIALTARAELARDDVLARYRAAYADEPLVEIVDTIPEVKDNAGQHGVRIGGFSVDGRRLVVVATLDNLLKGAATQAVQNLNLGLGLDELRGIR